SFFSFFCRWYIFVANGTFMLVPFHPFTFCLFLTILWIKYHYTFHSLPHLEPLPSSITLTFYTYCFFLFHHPVNNPAAIFSIFFVHYFFLIICCSFCR